ncbi:MAG: TerB family tellurite resistance protein [Thermoguttaceae bacterium]|nr:TerB family tellurite resistance protein [Thermoguttaceae bacterium]MBQ6615071.1 TerB family tellurite resistance protein [Thermoguttaceae bacterium]
MENNQLLSEEDIRFHLSALKKMAKADGVYDDSEKRFIDQITQVYISSYPDLDFETIQKKELSDEEYAQGLENLKQNATRSKLFLKDLITLGHADGDYSEPERKMVREIAAQLNISEDALQLLEQAVDSLIKASVLMNTALYS